VLTLLPGSLIVAIIPSLVVITVFLPSSNPQKSSEINYQVKSDIREGLKIKNNPLTYENLAKSLDLQALTTDETDESLEQIELSSEELAIHSMLGSVFNTMSNDSNRKNYRNKMIRPSKTVDKPAKRVISRESPEKFGNLDNNLEKEDDPIDVKLKVDPDGKLHYIFQNKEEIEHVNEKTKEKTMDKIDDPFTLEKSNRKRGPSFINELEE
jgi:hypothetical protein